MHIVGVDLLRAFYKLFYLRFCISEDQCKILCSKDYKEPEKHIYINISVTISAVNLMRSSLLSLFRPFVKTKNKNQIFCKLVIW